MVLSNLYVALHHGCQLHTRSRVVDLEKGRDKKGQKAQRSKNLQKVQYGAKSHAIYLPQNSDGQICFTEFHYEEMG